MDTQCFNKLIALVKSPIELSELAVSVSNLNQNHLTSLSTLPSRADYEVDLDTLQQPQPPSALSIVDAMVPSTSTETALRHKNVAYDTQGYSLHARTRIALLELVSMDRRLLQANIWIIPQLLALETFARDSLALPSHFNLFFSPQGTTKGSLEKVVNRTQQTLAYAFSYLGADASLEWHRNLTNALRKSKTNPTEGLGLGPLADVIASVFWASFQDGAVLSIRLFYYLLRGLLREGNSECGDLWLTLAQGQLDSSTRYQPSECKNRY